MLVPNVTTLGHNPDGFVTLFSSGLAGKRPSLRWMRDERARRRPQAMQNSLKSIEHANVVVFCFSHTSTYTPRTPHVRTHTPHTTRTHNTTQALVVDVADGLALRLNEFVAFARIAVLHALNRACYAEHGPNSNRRP